MEKLCNFYSEQEITLKTILRKDVIVLFTPYVNTIQDSIFVDYFNHLQKIENLTNSYLTTPAYQWKEEAWQGFYMELEDKLGMGNWGVDFYNEGFTLPLCPITNDEKSIQLYLYLDNSRNLCIKAICKAKCQPEKGWKGIQGVIEKELHDYLISKNLMLEGTEENSIYEGKNIKLCDIKRFQNNKRPMFIRKKLSYAEQSDIVPQQLIEIQQQLSIVAGKIKEKSLAEIK